MAPAANQLLVGGDTCNEQLGGVQALYDAEIDGAERQRQGTAGLDRVELVGDHRRRDLPAHLPDDRARDPACARPPRASRWRSPPATTRASRCRPPTRTRSASAGRSLGLGQDKQRLFETGWSNDDAYLEKGQWQDLGIGRDAAGGGTSLIWGQPKYQKGVVPARMSHVGIGANHTDRALPDIAADADATTGIAQIDIEHDPQGRRLRQLRRRRHEPGRSAGGGRPRRRPAGPQALRVREPDAVRAGRVVRLPRRAAGHLVLAGASSAGRSARRRCAESRA